MSSTPRRDPGRKHLDRNVRVHPKLQYGAQAEPERKIRLAHDLGLTVVAEGVEDRATWEVLARLGCDAVQGYVVSRPVAADEMVAWLGEQHLRAA